MAVTQRHTFGWNLETQLKPLFDTIHDMTFIKSAKRYDCIDFVGVNTDIELKSRVGKSTDYPDWLLPVCKAVKAEYSDKTVYFYYFWKTDNKLYRLKYDTHLFTTFRREYPFFNRNQEHFYIPADCWEYVGVVDLEKCCLVVSVD